MSISNDSTCKDTPKNTLTAEGSSFFPNHVLIAELPNEEKEKILLIILKKDSRQMHESSISSFNMNYLYNCTSIGITFDQNISPLLLACFLGKIDIVVALLTNDNINVNLCSEPLKYSPLMISCYKGYYEISRMLLERNADINLTNIHGQNAFLFCFSRLEQNSYQYENKQIFYMLVDLLLKYGINLNMILDPNKKDTILMRLVSGQIDSQEKITILKDILSFLVKRGADCTMKNNDGVSTLDIINESNAIKDEYRKELINCITQNTPAQIVNSNVQNRNTFNAYYKNFRNRNVVFEVQDGDQHCCKII